jgi:hypothetical protein
MHLFALLQFISGSSFIFEEGDQTAMLFQLLRYGNSMSPSGGFILFSAWLNFGNSCNYALDMIK